MSIIVYSPDFSGMHEIANATSVQMSYYYNDIGKLILDVPINAENVAALKNGSILYDTVKKLSYIIKNVKIDTTQNRITANGFTVNQILNSRVVSIPTGWPETEKAVYALVNGNLRGLTRINTAEPKGLPGSMADLSPYGGALLDEIMPLLANAELGHRMTWDHHAEAHTFEIYKGNDLTEGLHAVVFSEERGTARDLVIIDDVSEFKNVAYVQATWKERQTVVTDEGEKEETVETTLVETVGTATGDDRHEMLVEVSLTQDKEETKEQFKARMRTHGAMELGKQIREHSFSVSVDPSELGTMYNIGDLVACVSKRFGVRFNARISGVKYKKDSKAETTEIILGEPVLNTIGEVTLSG